MEKSDVATAYISTATNRFPHAAAVRNSLVAFASSTYVALWNTEDLRDNGVHVTLPGHEGTVTGVRFINDTLLLSADDRGFIKLWRDKAGKWEIVFSAAAHSKSISALAVYGDLVVTGASDSLVKIWQLSYLSDKDKIAEVQTISLKNRYPLTIDVTRLPRSHALVLAVGSTDRSIQIWTRSEDDFVASASLSGHEDWVKSLAFRHLDSDDKDLLVLASGSQDSTVRLWNIEPYSKQNTVLTTEQYANPLSDDLLDAFEASLGDLADAEEGGRQISLKRHIITVRSTQGSQQFSITFDALLVGHEAGVTSLSWRPLSADYSEPTLLSTSSDSSLILWSPSTIFSSSQEQTSTLWINRHRFGDIGGQRLGGFVLGLWSRNGKEALGCGWNGGWRRWRCLPSGEESSAEQWQESGAISGHSGPVRSLSWSPNGDYLISSGIDQTTRIHGKVHSGDSVAWHEIGRPQVHGYDLLDAAFLDPLRFVSIADEKVARVFEAPREFIETVQNLHVAELSTDAAERPRAATVPPLGLSNKAVSGEANNSTLYDVERTARRPFEGELAAFTLWPEIEKVFGHGYESITLAVSSSRKLAATACKATSPEHAVVRLYDTDKWQPFGMPLSGHTLTVTSITFSPDDKYIVTVSRDRSWRLFALNESGDGFIPVAADKSHARIIWDCCWAAEGDVFATASRDKAVKIWHTRNVKNSTKWSPEATLKLPEAATAVAFTSEPADNKRYLAIGLESGEIAIYSNEASSPTAWREDQLIPPQLAHVGQIHRLAWRPKQTGPLRQLASCSEDGTLKVLEVHIKK